ncbi:AAA family ATPase [Saccharothrix longispora]|uniref:DNA-binding CsgD family transcriptional regulator n=1 Tax=Saccharothrix longispora TaxID=33920 RepID=A0ABU1PR90_9PSEU|nr:AAA family ATPase [Saccharothrix longispora]MDR6593160.1 DNA-binding CsgD family transcriptional regulator [Saccharothrix longispora]
MPQGLLGREAELTAVRRAVARARAGGAGVVLLRGPRGSGKTALLDACAGLVGVPVRSVRCTEGAAPGEVVAGLVPDASPAGCAPPSHRYRTRLRELTRDAPLALLLDDAHWCDAESAETLDLLVRRVPRLLVVAAVGGAPRSADGTWGVAAARSHAVDLAPLTEAEVAELVRREWGVPGDPGFAADCARVTAGNPLALRLLLDRLRHAGVRPESRSTRAVVAEGVEVLADLLPAHLTRPDDAPAVAEAVAVLGMTDPASVATLVGVSEPLAAAVLADLGCAVLPRAADPRAADPRAAAEPAGLDLAARARLLGVLFAELDPAEVAVRHARAARMLSDAGRPAAEIAPHLLALPELPQRWMRVVLRDAARVAPDHDTTVRYLDRVLTDFPGDVPALVDYARAVGDRDPHAADRLLRSGLDAAGDPHERATLAIELALLAPAVPRAEPVLPLLDDALRPLVGADRELLVRGRAARLAASWTRAAEVSGESAHQAPAGDTPAERVVLALLAFTDLLGAAPAATAAARARTALAEPGDLGWPHAAAAFALAAAGDPGTAVAHLGRVLDTAAPTGWTRALAALLRALVVVDTGDPADAVADASAAIDALRTVDTARVVLAIALHRRGDTRAALDALPGTGADVPVLGRPLGLLLRADAAEVAGRPDEALRHLDRCAVETSELGVGNSVLAPWWLPSARLHAAAGRSRQAAHAAAAAWAAADRWDTPVSRGLALLTAGHAADRSGVDLISDAVDVLAGTPNTWHRVHAEVDLAEALLRGGDRGGARKWFRAAADRAGRTGYRAVAERLRARLVAAGGRLHRGADEGLTVAERRVAELAGAGVTNREIAERLRITLRTVETHLTNVYRKLDLPGRSALRPPSERD